jgi:hypothetical protein
MSALQALRIAALPRLALLVLVLLAAADVRGADAAPPITNLGPPTNDTGSVGSVVGFHRVSTDLRQGGKPELLFIGSQADEYSAAQEWPVVKALGRFGMFTSIGPTTTCSWVLPPYAPAPGHCSGAGDVASFDWDNARYSSAYLSFVHRDLIDRSGRFHVAATSAEQYLLLQHYKIPHVHTLRGVVFALAQNQYYLEHFPLIAVGRYVLAGPNYAGSGDLFDQSTHQPLSFSTILTSLQRSQAVGKASFQLVADVNADANILTALICHADGMKPRGVCARAVIRHLAKGLR